MPDNHLTIATLRAHLRALGLSEQPVCLHASLRSFGIPVEGGGAGIVQAFLDENCTLLTPSFTWNYAVPPPPYPPPPARNGWDYHRPAARPPGTNLIYTAATIEIDTADMGAVAASVARWPGRARGNHPLNSFAAVGPLAATLIAGQSPTDVYAPLRALADRGGTLLLIGVNLTKLTALHLAERQAGRTLFRRWANNAHGQPIAVEVGGCSSGFDAFEPVLARLGTTAQVAGSRWRAYPAAALLTRAAQAIQTQPSLTHCPNPTCERCRDAIAGGPILPPA